MNSQKGFVIPIIIAIVAVIALGGGYYYTQKQSVCWPYCKGMTDQDRDVIKQSTVDQGVTTTPIIDTVKINDKITINGVSITPLKITEDSRCPQGSNIKCIWAGTVRLDTEINDKKINLVLGKSTSISGYEVTLLKVLPNKSTTTILSSDYSFEFSVMKSTSTLIGGDKESHGCIGSAGYSWCELKNKYLKVWEEKCEATTTSQFKCKNNNDCKEISCVGGGFAHELCIEGKCTMSNDVKNRCSASTTTSIIEKESGLIKSIVVNMTSDKMYLNIDYVTMNPDWRPGGNSGPAYTNLNTQTISFEINSDVKIFVTGNKEITLNEFANFFNPKVENGVSQYQYQALNPWNIEIENGIVVKIHELFLP